MAEDFPGMLLVAPVAGVAELSVDGDCHLTKGRPGADCGEDRLTEGQIIGERGMASSTGLTAHRGGGGQIGFRLDLD